MVSESYNMAEWVGGLTGSRFWWLDLNSYIMEPSISIEKHLLNDLRTNTYRDINLNNPLNITHPPDLLYLLHLISSSLFQKYS